MKITMLDNYKGFINLVFGILLAVIGYLLVDKLGQIDNSLREITRLQQVQLVRNENFELRIRNLERGVYDDAQRLKDNEQEPE